MLNLRILKDFQVANLRCLMQQIPTPRMYQVFQDANAHVHFKYICSYCLYVNYREGI